MPYAELPAEPGRSGPPRAPLTRSARECAQVPTLSETLATKDALDMNSGGGSFSYGSPREATGDSAAGIGQRLPPVVGEGAQPESRLAEPRLPAAVSTVSRRNLPCRPSPQADPPSAVLTTRSCPVAQVVKWLETSKECCGAVTAWSDTQYQMLVVEEQVVWTTNAWRQLLTGDGEPNSTGPWPGWSLLQLIQGPLTDKAAVAELLRALRTGERTVVSVISHTVSGRPFSHSISLEPLDVTSAMRSFQAISSDVQFLALSEEQLMSPRDVMLPPPPTDASSAAAPNVGPATVPAELLSLMAVCPSVMDMLSSL